MPYATRDDVFLLALSAQAFVTLARPVPTIDVDIATGTIRLKAHGFAASDLIALEVKSGGALPSGGSGTPSAYQTYAPIPVSGDLFRITGFTSWTSAGAGWSVSVDFGRRLDAHLAETAAQIDENLTADEPPLKPDPITGKYPLQVVGMNARMAARAAVLSLQIENAAFRVATDRLFAKEVEDVKQLEIWRLGKPINPRPTDQTDQADNGAVASSFAAVPWRRVCGPSGQETL